MTNKFTSNEFFLLMLSVNRSGRDRYSISDSVSVSYNTINRFRDKLQSEGIDYDLGHSDFKNFIKGHPSLMSYWGGRIHVTITDIVLDIYADRLARFEFENPQCIAWWNELINEGENIYTPNPIDTSDIELSDDLMELSERLAENAHENWAEQRMKDGWKYGAHRSDEKKQHPCLVPYCLLSDEEKEYDRILSIETLKVLVAMGYDIVKK